MGRDTAPGLLLLVISADGAASNLLKEEENRLKVTKLAYEQSLADGEPTAKTKFWEDSLNRAREDTEISEEIKQLLARVRELATKKVRASTCGAPTEPAPAAETKTKELCSN